MQSNVIYNKSCLTMEEIEDNSIDTIVTSCPYWGLRDYGKGANQIWGGNPDCEHEWIAQERWLHRGSTKSKKVPGHSFTNKKTKDNFCQLCGAWYGQLGLEPTLEMYIEHLLLITAECKRVLKPTGVMWWNHADCYFTGKGSCNNPGGGPKSWKSWNDRKAIFPRGRGAPNRMSKEIPTKCLALQNFRLIIRLIDEQGWILRNTAIWNKPNSMPSSTKDRLTNKYEPVFFLVKNTKTQYYWNEKTGLMANRKSSPLQENIDWEWIECPKCEGKGEIIGKALKERVSAIDIGAGIIDKNTKAFKICPRCKGIRKIKRSFWHSLDYWFDLDAIREPYTKPLDRWGGDKTKPTDKSKGNQFAVQERSGRERRPDLSGKNPGDVWTIPTQPYPEAHFATFPEKLIIKPILSSCPEWICNKCGKARVRISKVKSNYTKRENTYQPNNEPTKVDSTGWKTPDTKTIGWTDCGCNVGWRPGITLDLFAGSGTTLAVSKRLGRQFIGYEIVKSYIPLIRKSLEKENTMFNRDLKEQFV